MKLHTNFHDYYDEAVGYGIDDNVHYNRFVKEIEIQLKPKFDIPNRNDAHLLGFCGNIYPFIELKKFNKRYDEYDFDDYQVVARYCAYSFEEYKNKAAEWKSYGSSFEYSSHSRQIKLKQFFIDWRYQSDDIFLKYKVPVWTTKLESYQNKGLINPKLKDYGFERIKDSSAAFQEISMYLSNILIEQKEPVVIEDKFKIENHGFDLRTSFRKEKKL